MRRAWPLLAPAVFVVAALLPSAGLFDRALTGDVPLYHGYGERFVHGAIPYRDFFMEYPPGSLAAFVPTTAAHDSLLAFKVAMLLCAAAIVVAAALALRRLRADTSRRIAALGVLALAPLLLGPVLTTHYDPWPAVLTGAALALLLSGRDRAALAAIGLAAAVKVYPLVLAPLAVLYIRRRRGPREGWIAAAWGAAVLALVVLPFLVLAPGGVRFSLSWEARRPLEIESLGASLLLAAGRAGAYSAERSTGYNSVNLAGGAAHAAAALTGLVELLALVAVWLLFARSRRDDETLLTASAAAVLAVVAFGKVLSPQYVVWLLPLVPLVGGGTGLLAGLGLVAVCGLTQALRVWGAPGDGGSAWVLLARNLLLVALFALLVRLLVAAAFRRRPSAARDASARSGASPGDARGS